MLDLPFFLPAIMILATGVALYFFYQSVPNTMIFYFVLAWTFLQGVISASGFYTDTEAMPPRFTLVILPPLVLIITTFISAKGRQLLNNFDPEKLTLLHASRFLVELVLWGLFLNEYVPKDLTFEGRNFDILAGLTAPLVAYFGIRKKVLSKNILLLWNILCLGLLLNVVIMGVLSAPLPFQQFNFDQPNIGLLYFPYVFIPGVVVQLVFFSHLVEIWRLAKK